jgi:opacity protein-like surface antigen
MKKSILTACLMSLALLSSQAFAADATCETKAVDKNGKALAGAAKTSFMKKCEAEAGGSATAACEAKAVDKNGKALAGAAKTSSVKKCVADATKK